MRMFRCRAARATWVGVLVGPLTLPSSVQGRAQTPLHRLRTANSDSAVLGRVTVFFAPVDRAHASKLAALLDSAADYFQTEFGRPLAGSPST